MMNYLMRYKQFNENLVEAPNTDAEVNRIISKYIKCGIDALTTSELDALNKYDNPVDDNIGDIQDIIQMVIRGKQKINNDKPIIFDFDHSSM